MFKPTIKTVNEVVDDGDLVKKIKKLEKQLANKKEELRTKRKNAVLKYKSEMLNGEIIVNTYCNSCYVYHASIDDLYIINDD